MVSFIIVLLAGCNLMDPQIVRFNRPMTTDTDTGDTGVDTDETGEDTGDSDTDTDTGGDSDTSVVPVDVDGDGFNSATDCDDTDATVNPAATETCNGMDDNCDGTVDESGATGETSWYADDDGDTYGDAAVTAVACSAPSGYVADATDCDDTDGSIHPYAEESCTGTVDANCDGSAGTADADGDLVQACEDCDDTNASVYPGASESCDGVDNDCDKGIDNDAVDAVVWYVDNDGDSFGSSSTFATFCSAPSGYVADATDCDDTRADVNPGEDEQCDGLATDENCNGLADDADASVLASGKSHLYHDGDGDSYGDPATDTMYCSSPDASWIGDATDCDDTDATVNPAATETCNGMDDNCDGTVDESGATGETSWYADDDGDTYGDAAVTAVACSAPSGYVADATDCDDTDGSMNPGAPELCDAVDNDCSGVVDDGVVYTAWYMDVDLDLYGDGAVTVYDCSQPLGYVADATDCDDTDATVNPAATETCNGMDDNCDGTVDESGATGETSWYADDDVDGYGNIASTVSSCSVPLGYVADNTDCDDAHAEVNPAQAESVYTVWDDDCDGTTYTGLTLAYGVAATSDSYIVDDLESTFESGISGNWDVISNVLGLTAADMVVSSGTWSNTLVGTYDGLEFFGTGGAASQDDECRVYVGPLETEAGLTVHSGDRLAVVFSIDNDAAARNGIGVYLGDAWDTATWSSLSVLLPINPSTDEFEVATGNATMDDPNVIICAGGIATSGMVRFTHLAVVTY